MKYYPVFWNITGKKCVVVGGGEVAQRKALRLIDCGAKVFVISPALTGELASLKDKNEIIHIAGKYSPSYIEDAALVISATDDDEVNAAVSRDARTRGIPVNVVDDPQKCDFILPSLVERGDLTIAVGTAGNSPALARHLREEMEKTYGEEYAALNNILGQLRPKMEKNAEVGKAWFERLMGAGLLDALRRKNREKAKQIVREATGEEVEFEF
ncbi:MAG TPA: bifunctional precorrin-2 dehydrogenase/sirohydrochlorin ferrochelatase [Smithellaceae bacterium]|nr:bifunctional precorrin-2 dehydrogenase/sirohydrochlorin ferrochelatase [Smithellaceae bacterium]HRS89512.1 bifunctional precorrin-2 dehydrogenase/sirohydrochlorin ferrochelatase [Smithellaceae bacterium]HRV26462.1 bifunctional precorrin-2 dehydrogenase/sirohydrochlorin ferrochelatase [Smithellaceae bacterium]